MAFLSTSSKKSQSHINYMNLYVIRFFSHLKYENQRPNCLFIFQLLYCTTTWYGRSISWIKTYIRNISFSIIRNKINRIRFEFITISVIIYRLIIVSNFLIQYAENSSDNKEREIHAVLVVVFPLLKRRDLGCLCFTPTRRFLTRKYSFTVLFTS